MSCKNGSKKINFLFQHGWGFDRSCWNKMLPGEKRANLVFSDRGYFSPAAPQAKMPPEGFEVIVCHSLGLHLVPDSLFARCRLLVLIACFQSFHGETALEGKISTRHLRGMLQELEAAPLTVLQKFHQNCASPFSLPDVKAINQKLLLDDLHFLNRSRFDLDLIGAIPQILLLHGTKDRIVPLQRSRQIVESLNHAHLIEIENAGHGLLLTHPEKCWAPIRAAIFT
jgi:pimeloyl-ACP methyl ester carboxylesterase